MNQIASLGVNIRFGWLTFFGWRPLKSARYRSIPLSGSPSFKIIVILASIGSLGPFAIDTYLPALPGMVEGLGTTTGMIQWTLAAYLIGIAVFPLFLAPFSDALGRKPTLYWALFAFVVISALCAFAPNIEMLIALRLAQAAAGGTVMTVARAVLADLYRGDTLSRAMSYLMLVFTTAPIIAPLIGGVVLEFGGWRWVFGFLSLIALVIMSATLALPETVPESARRKFSVSEAAQGYLHIARSRRARGYLFLTFASSLFFFAMLSGAPFIFIDHFDVTPLQFSYFFAGISAAALLGNFLNMRLVLRRGYARMLRDCAYGVTVLAIAMAAVAMTGVAGVWGVFGVMLWLMAAYHISAANSTAGLMDQLGQQAGGASAVLALFRFIGGAIGSGLIGVLGDSHPWTFAVVLGISAAGMLLSLRLVR